MDRGAWRATVRGVARAGLHSATAPAPPAGGLTLFHAQCVPHAVIHLCFCPPGLSATFVMHFSVCCKCTVV